MPLSTTLYPLPSTGSTQERKTEWDVKHQNKKESKEKESIQSSTTPVLGYKMGKYQVKQ